MGLGTNDALASRPLAKQIFQSNYDAQLHELSKLTTRLFVLDIPPVEARGRFSPDTQQRIAATIRDYGSVLPEVAAHNGARFLHLPDMAALSTIDGVHLSTEGYHIWETAIMEGVAQACGG